MVKMVLLRINPEHYLALQWYLNTYIDSKGEDWSFRHAKHDSSPHLYASQKICDLAHAFDKGRESMTEEYQTTSVIEQFLSL